ncbi:MarR family winged helix-turn-helix transcriptional regulator [Acidocella sp.]|uniref:MarR family winged helix-turn-helix transcriptional regulator n=1 Tax=Acidocella sp. TaxID=50710 RepID=UPI00260374B2|nr:MarR family transcriptional regulator [Acidocella sp.]
MPNAPTQPYPASKRETLPSATHATPGAGLLFLREDELRAAQDMLFFALRDLNGPADTILAELKFGRAHHRCLHWIGRKPGLNVGELLSILGITKQSLTRVLGPLIHDGYVAQTPGVKDRRQRLLTLTEKGATLERQLFETQREKLLTAYRDAGGPAVEGFKRVMRGLIGPGGQAYIETPKPARVT